MSAIELEIRPATVSRFEIVERKGIGHPDTIADALAEELSRTYARYTLEHFGAILHHNFDKVSVLGGRTEVDFGSGRLLQPIRIILNGRASTAFGNAEIPVRQLLEAATRVFFARLFNDLIEPSRDLHIHWMVSNASGPGKLRSSTGSRANLFTPRNLSEVKGYDQLLNNDTSIGCAYAPYSRLESAVLEIERYLNSLDTKVKLPWLGTDIKVMGARSGDAVQFTICLPQIARHVPSASHYLQNLADARELIHGKLAELLSTWKIALTLNSRDNIEKGDLYMTAIGSSVEAGDEGIVGRGNRVNGLITPMRPMNLEGACGKNPKYYSGKLYNVGARVIADRIYRETSVPCEVYLVSQAGRPVTSPWKTFISLAKATDEDKVRRFVLDELERFPALTDRFLAGSVRLY